ncbi:MAG TPA: 2Fe-2S iron-sulfur cluster-binding protein, partial [Burkholderiaceae bacterium]|nr:2Fe-2S iron-sulfur cluster-binding protein [Burkholderiaceae bacterium]
MAVAAQTVTWWPASRAAALAQFGAPVRLSIDGSPVDAPTGASVLNAADNSGHYIPALCAHPDLPPSLRRAGGGGCKLCLVEIDGREGLQDACSVTVESGMVVRTDSVRIRSARQARLASILASHPHVCLTCPQREGCSRTQCSYGNPPETRCCSIFANCELRKISDYIGIPNTTPAYKPAQLPVIKDEPFFDRDYNLCIDCRRCLTACNEVRGVGCLEIKEVTTAQGRRSYVGTIAPTLLESGCKFCQACATVCPT